MDRVTFAVNILGGEQRRDKKPREAIQRRFEFALIDIKEIVGTVVGSERVAD